MNMNMKNEKTMLALVLVAALAMVSVAGVALASESDAGIDVNNGNTTIDAEGYSGPVTVNAGGSLIIIGEYTGTITFTNVPAHSTPIKDSEIRTTIVCTGVSGITFVNGNDSTNAVTLYGTTDGTIELTKGTITLGKDANNAFSGSVNALEETIASSATYGTVVTIIPASSTGAVVIPAYVQISGTTTSDVTKYLGGVTAEGLSNELLGNELTVNKVTTTSGTKYYLAGTIAKQDLNGASAIGTVAGYKYAIIVDGSVCKVTVNTAGKITAVAGIPTDWDFSGLKVGTSTSAGVSGNYTGILTIVGDVTVDNTTATVDYSIASKTIVVLSASSTVTLAKSSVVNIDGQFVNYGDLQALGTIDATAGSNGTITNYGTFTATNTVGTSVLLNGFYYQDKTTSSDATKQPFYGFATLSETVAAAGTNTVFIGGSVIINENVTITKTQSVTVMGYGANGTSMLYIDGTSSISIYGAFKNGVSDGESTPSLVCAVDMTIASDATLDLSNAEVTQATGINPTTNIDVNGILVMKKETAAEAPTRGAVSTYIGSVIADTFTETTTTYSFINLYTALTTITTSEDKITLLNDATLNKSATLADGVTFLNNGCTLKIVKDVTLTANGHFQFQNTDNAIDMVIEGILIINDDVTPVTYNSSNVFATSPAGSFITGGGTIFLTGTIEVSEGAVFEIGVTVKGESYTSDDAAGSVIINGTLNNAYYTPDIEGYFNNLEILTVSSTGILNNENTMIVESAVIAGIVNNNNAPTAGTVQSYFKAKTLLLTGTFNNKEDVTSGTAAAGILFVETFYLTGVLNAGTAVVGDSTATTDGVFISKVMYIGVAGSEFDEDNLTGTVVLAAYGADASPYLGTASYAVTYGTYDATDVFAYLTSTTVKTTTFYLGEDVYATEYAIGSVKITLVTPVVSGYDFVGWYDNAQFTGSAVTVNAPGKIGGASDTDTKYVALYGKLEVKTTSVSLGYMQNGTWVVDGASCGSSATLDLTVGTHTIKFVADNGYELGDDYVIYVDGKAITGTSFTVGDNKITVTYGGEVKEKSTSGGLDLVTILLIIITIVIIIMAIIIALKLMRS